MPNGTDAVLAVDRHQAMRRRMYTYQPRDVHDRRLTMYCPPGKWQIFSGGASGVLQINFLGGAGDPINGSAFGHPIEGNWLTSTGDISFKTTDGTDLYYTGSLQKPRANAPEAATYLLAGLVNPSGFVWVAEISVVP